MNAPADGARAHGRRRLARRGAVTVLAIAASALALYLGLGMLRARREALVAQPHMEGELRVPGLTAPVEISRDARGIPHVEAANEPDALFGLGFVQAQDRVGQMIWLRASARGRAAELVGESALAADREARTIGIALLAQAQVARLDPATRAALQSYASGVNACLARMQSGEDPLPLSLRGIESGLEPWTPADSIAVLKLEAFALGSSMRVSVLLSELIETLGGIASQPYFPDAQRGAQKAPGALPDMASSGPGAAGERDPLRAAAGLDGRGVGSSVLVVGARSSASGRPLVAGDSHAQPTVPARFYDAHLRGGNLDVAGATIPGAPVVFSGHNRRIAWAASFAPAVVTDLYVESLSKDGTRYHDGRALTPLLERVEKIAVRGRPTVELRVRSTSHGPLINDLLEGEHPPLALAWTGALPGDGVTGLLQAAHASSAAELRAALRVHHEPVLAFGYGDAQGASGLQLAGFLPRRGLPTGLVPVPGRTEDYDWRGSVPFELLPEESADAAPGFAVASDGRIGPGNGTDEIEWLWRPGATSARLRALLAAAVAEGPLDVRALAAMQLDVESPSALALLAHALALAGDPSELGAEGRDVAAALARWDGRMASDSVGAAVYQVFLQRLTQEVLVQRLGEALARRYQALPQTYPVQVVAGILEAAAALPDSGDEARSQIVAAVRRSLRESWLWLLVSAGPNREKWAWGRLHPLQFRPLGLFPKPDATEDLGLGPFAYGGDALTVNVGGYDLLDPFGVRVASTHRFAIDAAQLDQALTALVPGQSEHPGSPHLSDGVAGWIEGRPRLLLTSRLLIEEATRTRLVLRP